MDQPRYLLVAMALYAFSFLVTMAFFIIPAVQAGLTGYVDFYMFLALTLLPLALLLVYLRTGLGDSHGTVLRLAFVIATVALSMVFIFIISPVL